MWTLYGNLVSTVICTREAELRASRLGQPKLDVKYGSKHFIINMVQKDSNVYSIYKYKDILNSSRLLNKKIDEERLILEVSIMYKSKKVVERHEHIESLMPSNPSKLYSITLDSVYFKKNHISKVNTKNRRNILTYFVKTWANDISDIDVIEEDERQYILGNKDLSLSPLEVSSMLIPNLINENYLFKLAK